MKKQKAGRSVVELPDEWLSASTSESCLPSVSQSNASGNRAAQASRIAARLGPPQSETEDATTDRAASLLSENLRRTAYPGADRPASSSGWQTGKSSLLTGASSSSSRGWLESESESQPSQWRRPASQVMRYADSYGEPLRPTYTSDFVQRPTVTSGWRTNSTFGAHDRQNFWVYCHQMRALMHGTLASIPSCTSVCPCVECSFFVSSVTLIVAKVRKL